jgi:hypothetical protein
MNWMALLAIVVSLVVFYVAGSLLLWLARFAHRQDSFFDTFVKLLVGLVGVVTTYAVVKTSGNTILWGFIIIGVLCLWHSYKGKMLSKEFYFREIVNVNRETTISLCAVFVLGIVSFLFQGSFFYASPINNMPHGDYAFYATVSSVLGNFGVETSDWEPIVLYGSSAPAPYHYFDIWLPTIFLGILHGDTYESFVVITQSIYMVILSMGVIAITRRFTNNKLMQVLSVLSIFFAGLLFIRILPQSSDFIFSNSCSLKYLSVSMFVVWTVLAMLEKKGGWYLPMICLPIVNVITAPVTFITVVLLLCLSALRKRSIKHIILPLVSVFVVAVFIVLFYFLQAGESASGGLSLSTLLDSFAEDKTKPFKIIFGAVAILASIYIYYLIPTVVSLVSRKRKEYFFLMKDDSIVFVAMVIVVCVGVVVWGLTHVMADSIQFFMVSAIPWINISIWLLILFSYKVSAKKVGYFVCAFVLLISGLNFYQIDKVPFYRYYQPKCDVKYVKNVSYAISEIDGVPFGAFIRDSTEMNDLWDFGCFAAGAGFKHYTKDLYITVVYPEVNIERYSEIDRPRIIKVMKNNPFQKFLTEYKSKNADYKYGDVVLKFLKAQDCRFIYLGKKCEMPETIGPYIEKQYVDEKTGEKFFVLKRIDNGR